MLLTKLLAGLTRHSTDENTVASRRAFLLGLTAVGATAATGSLLIATTPSDAAAAAPMTLRPDLSDDPAFQDVQYRDRRHDRRRDRRRYSRRELRRRCDRDRRFRRDNRNLCRRVNDRPRRSGSCVEIGPVLLCD